METVSDQPTNPATAMRRSQLYRWHLAAGAQHNLENGSCCVSYYSDRADEHQLAGLLGLADLSTLPRIGFKGRSAPDWMVQQGVELPDGPNRARPQSDGSLVAQLSAEETLLMSDLQLGSVLAEQLHKNWSIDAAQATYLLPRADSHCWFALTGKHASDAFSKVCAIDLRKDHFSQGDIAQTSLARVNAIIVRNDIGALPCFYILSDASSAEFLWTSLLDAMLEYNGGPVGVSALQQYL